MIKYFKALWQRLFHKEPEPEDTRHYLDIPRCGTHCGLTPLPRKPDQED